jgi:hypothetical protein
MAETQICTGEKISPPVKEYTLDIQKVEVEVWRRYILN